MNGDYVVWAAALLNVTACIAYASSKDVARAFYWGGATIIVFSTIFMGR